MLLYYLSPQTDGADPKVRTRHIYSLAGFEKGESNLIPYHQGWLADFGNAMRECGVNRPKIRIIGFSSAETFKGPIERLPNLCKSQRPRTTQEESAINNCSLANHRVGEVASAIFEAMKTARRPTKEELLNSMNSQCAGSAGDFQPANFTFMNIKPWCQVPDMQNARFSVGSDDVEKQPNFLNKGVHIVILDSNNCPGF